MVRICVLLLFCLTAGFASADDGNTPAQQDSGYNYKALTVRIASGHATIEEVRQALTDKDAGRLTNTVHALYSMRWHVAVVHLIHDMWDLQTAKYPELSWDLLKKPPVRIALASTVSRIQVANTGKYLDYMRAHEHDKQEFIRAQVVVGLGLNGYKEDVPYIKSMAESDDHYVVQSAVASLGFMQSGAARDALEELWLEFRGTPRQDLIEGVLKKVYRVEPRERPKQKAKPDGGIPALK